MEATELQEIKEYWTNKYPHVDILIYPRLEGTKYCGTMRTHDKNFHLNAETIGEFISQGENFLRTIT